MKIKFDKKEKQIQVANMNDYIEDNINKLEYDCFTGTYWLQDEEWEEPREFTADELITEGIYLNEYCERI